MGRVQTEWYELVQQKEVKNDDLAVVPDVYVRNQALVCLGIGSMQIPTTSYPLIHREST